MTLLSQLVLPHGANSMKKHIHIHQPYLYAVSARGMDENENVIMCVTIRADYGSRSVCIFRGILNRSYWHDYPEIEKTMQGTISITPAIVSKLIDYAHANGWDPVTSRSNIELVVDNDLVKSL